MIRMTMTKNKMLRQKFDVILLMQLINLKWSIEIALKMHKLLTFELKLRWLTANTEGYTYIRQLKS